ncbi:MAG: MBL fold metallo-hydrolase [Planctomycetota bacterium]|jgi:glyoxylase-like metal-dependent hydrolase (beta-lactamase superfamily II)
MREITPEEIVASVESGKPLEVLDLRKPEQLGNGKVDLVAGRHFHNVPVAEYFGAPGRIRKELPKSVPIAVVCSRGNDSQKVAADLEQAGFDAYSLKGGIFAWMRGIVERELSPPPMLDRFVQYDRFGLGSLAYLLVSDGEALLVDPPRDFDPDLGGAKLVGVADTHCHADFISGSPALATKYGVPYYLGAQDNMYPYDGTPGKLDCTQVEFFKVGRATVRMVPTPGHTEGSVTYLISKTLALTGDFIFIASVGRPDLGGKVKEWTTVLWNSLAMAREEMVPGTLVFPAHYASDAERNADRTFGKPFGDLLESNEALRIANETEFTDWVLRKSRSFPERYKQIKAVNVGLKEVTPGEADTLEAGRNECALA